MGLYDSVDRGKPKPKRLTGPIALCCALFLLFGGLTYWACHYQFRFHAFISDLTDSTRDARSTETFRVTVNGSETDVSIDDLSDLLYLIDKAGAGRTAAAPEEMPYAVIDYGDGSTLEIWKVELVNPSNDWTEGPFFRYTDAKGKRRTHWVGDVYLKKNIVDMVRSGEELRAWDDMEREPGTKRFYTYMLSCHDSDHYIVKGSPITIGYQAIFAPFIPLWYVGEEWDNAPRFFVDYFYRRDKHPVPKKWRLYGNVIDWAQKEENRDFFELVKKMIRIRRQHPESGLKH